MDCIRLKNVIVEDFCNYKSPSMFLITSWCDWKCCKECNQEICQNLPLASLPVQDYHLSNLFKTYIENSITSAIVIGGLEPFMQVADLYDLIEYFREKGCQDPFVIYTGYTEDEVKNNKDFSQIFNYNNIIIKFGRFIPDQQPHFDEILGVNLASDNQYAKEFNYDK